MGWYYIYVIYIVFIYGSNTPLLNMTKIWNNNMTKNAWF